MPQRLTKQDNMQIVHSLVQEGGLRFCYFLTHKKEPKRSLRWAKLLTSDGFITIMALVIFFICIPLSIPDFDKALIIIGSCGALALVAIGADLLISNEDEEDDYDWDFVEDYANSVIGTIGLNTNVRYILGHSVSDQYRQDIFDLASFAYCVDKKDNVDAYLDQYSDLITISDGLNQAWNAHAVNDYAIEELKRQYVKLLDAFLGDLYTLCAPTIGRVAFRLIEQKEYDYLPDSISKDFVNKRNERLLHELSDKK